MPNKGKEAVRHPRPLIQRRVAVPLAAKLASAVESETIIAQSSGQRRVWTVATAVRRHKLL